MYKNVTTRNHSILPYQLACRMLYMYVLKKLKFLLMFTYDKIQTYEVTKP